MLVETHLHTEIGSHCGWVPPEEIPWLYKKAGFDAIVVTEHYYERKYEYHRNVDKWLEGYRRVRNAGKAAGVKVFLGMELRLSSVEEDFLVYGFDERFIRKNDKIYRLSLPEVFEFLDSHRFLIYQAHPFRTGCSICDHRFLHGIEVYNGNPRQTNNDKRAAVYAKKHSLLQISGSDFHRYEDAGRGGIYIDEAVETEKELAEYLRMHEVRQKI